MTAPSNKNHVLVVEDNPDLGILMQLRLQKFNLSVSLAVSGKTAVESALDLAPALVFLDYRLPDMSGAEVAQKLSEALDICPSFVMITGYSTDQVKDEANAAGIFKIVRKPISSEELAKVVKEFT